MKGLFSYDSPLGQVLMFIADLFIVNIVFLLCCIPIVTIGPAQSGLYNAMRVLQDREDDSSPLKAFFRGFKNGFLSISVMWTLFFIFDIVLLYTTLMCFSYAETGLFIHWAVPLVGLVFSLILHGGMSVFHSQFQCTTGQLVRNTFLLLISHPLCTLAVAALTWAPVVLFFLYPSVFFHLSPLFLTVYYSIAFMLGALVMKKPFQQLIDQFYAPVEEGEEEAAAETEN